MVQAFHNLHATIGLFKHEAMGGDPLQCTFILRANQQHGRTPDGLRVDGGPTPHGLKTSHPDEDAPLDG